MPDSDISNLVNRGLVSRDAYASFLKKFNPQFGAAPAAAAETKDGKAAKPPLDIRPPAARNQPIPTFAGQMASGGRQATGGPLASVPGMVQSGPLTLPGTQPSVPGPVPGLGSPGFNPLMVPSGPLTMPGGAPASVPGPGPGPALGFNPNMFRSGPVTFPGAAFATGS